MSEHDTPSAHEWEAALERLEVQLNRAERMGTAVDAKDIELGLPASLSTIPRYLLDRAQVLVERQQKLASMLPERGTRPTDAFTLHDRVGHLVTGPREPVSFDLFGASAKGERTAD
ncbi:hypothetical protein GCM10009798_16570 [Nocardioides panacihumi]|uniref:DUF222 domain-containing protein n=1 Tax=Nocardioides panacihumi TaxID=400774 RepID=A0ABP5C7L2_9ACTN